MFRRTKSRIAFEIFNYLFLTAWFVICVLPFIHIIAVSFSGRGPADANFVGLWPLEPTTENYVRALNDEYIVQPFFNSIKRVILGVCFNMLITVITAYPLCKEKKDFPGRSVYTWFFIFTMLFSGGLIPSYLLMRNLGLLGNMWALILPGTVPIFNILVLLNFFRQLPKEIEEAAIIDGASQAQVLVRIFLPLSAPCLATLVLFSAIGHWNAWFDGMIYMRSPEQYPLTTYLQVIQTRLTKINSYSDAQKMERIARRSLLMSYITISMLPIMFVYPFLQRHIKKGLVLGSVKG
ncbi:ABC transporter permease [Spirochaetia bacterium]|nr:ABC transporter permease [Spirochaetia bacterium]